MKHTLEIDSVILEFDSKRILQSVYLKCETGAVTGLLGRNGTGKSSLMKILYGELNPNNKSIRLDGNTLIGNHRSPLEVRYLPQGKFIPSSLTVQRVCKDFNLDFYDMIQNFPEFEKLHKTKMTHLSGGERRIMGIYALLVSRTKFCILDEPFSQIMPIHVDIIKNLIVREKGNKGIIITDHMYRHVIDLCDDLYVISNGKTHLSKNPSDLQTLGYTRS